MDSIRLRLVFEDRQILSKSQKNDGLSQSWVLLKPHLHTISDLSIHLLHIFELQQSCPHGLLLFMDGFVLPSFESTSIFKDKDIICVKKKGTILPAVIEGGDAIDSGEELDVVEKEPVHAGLPLLANEEFDKETDGYRTESEENEEYHMEGALHVEDSAGGNAFTKKRKAVEQFLGSNSKHGKKKQCMVAPDDAEDEVPPEQNESCHEDEVLSCKTVQKKTSNAKDKSKSIHTPKVAKRKEGNAEVTPNIKKNDQLQEKTEGIDDESDKLEGTKKRPSRSARRKKAKRAWLRAMTKIGKKDEAGPSKRLVTRKLNWNRESDKVDKRDLVCQSKGLINWKQEPAKAAKKDLVSQSKGLLHWKHSPEKDANKSVMGAEQLNQSNDAEDAVYPIVVRPGHIRFEPLEQDEAIQQSQAVGQTSQCNGTESKDQKWGINVNENFQWNGITNKKKGQKWGKERWSTSRRNGYKDLDKECTELVTLKRMIPAHDSNGFDKLPPLPSVPKEGDVIAYRLLELSSTWTPELSSFRVGKTAWYNPESRKVKLVPVPEYPIVPEKSDEGASAQQPDNSLYREDGSLQVDFLSLIDIRVIKQGGSDSTSGGTCEVNEDLAGDKDVLASVMASNNSINEQTETPNAGVAVNLWDHFSETLNSKKALLTQANGWSNSSSGKSSWSYKALRGSALGPTMAVLRSKNAI